jgi:hypothetical protein
MKSCCKAKPCSNNNDHLHDRNVEQDNHENVDAGKNSVDNQTWDQPHLKQLWCVFWLLHTPQSSLSGSLHEYVHRIRNNWKRKKGKNLKQKRTLNKQNGAKKLKRNEKERKLLKQEKI